MKDRQLDALVNKLTAFRSFAALQACQQERGYVPTIYRRDGRHARLIRLLRQRGLRVWTGKTEEPL